MKQELRITNRGQEIDPNRIELKQLQLGEWNVKYTDSEVILPSEIVENGRSVVKTWTKSFPKEDTWVQRTYNLPSLLVRLDATIVDQKLEIYEVEDRPAGVGINYMTNPDFKARLDRVKSTWPPFTVVVSPERRGSDDHLWNPTGKPSCAEQLIMVRAEPWEQDFHQFQNQSISTVLTEGDKSYGEKMGLWSKVTKPEELPFDSSFVLKPLQGSKGHNVLIHDLEKSQGATRASEIRRQFRKYTEQNEGMYLQPLLRPMSTGNDEFPFMIFRYFYGFDTNSKEWNCLGGSWMARNNMKIHGASDSLMGQVKPSIA